VDVVVVVPRRRRVHDPVTRIDERAIGRVDAGPRAGRHDHRRQVRREAELPRVERAHRFPQRDDAVARRVVGLAAAQRVDDPALELLGNPELRGGEVADREIADVSSVRGQRAYVGGDLQDLGADERPREG
jgi:hypothetical protein